MKPQIITSADDPETKRLQEESKKARDANSTDKLTREIADRTKRHPDKKEVPKADDR